MITDTHCRGCRDDFYNGRNPMGVQKCWMLETAKLVTRYRIHRDTRPTEVGAFKRVKVPDCYNGSPWYYYKALPDFVSQSERKRLRYREVQP